MRRQWVANVAVASLVWSWAGVIARPEALGPVGASAPNVAEQYLQAAADRERAGLGLPPLRRDAALVEAARAHAFAMVEHNSISHQFAGEPDLAARGAAAGARFSVISENVAESPSAVRIHTAWMNSEGHRHNLLDLKVDAVGIAVIARGHQLFAVEDFERTVKAVPLNEQESAVAEIVSRGGVAARAGDAGARRACADEDGAAWESSTHGRRPEFVMRYTTADLERVPEQLQSRLNSGKYQRAVVGACAAEQGEEFSMYRLAVLLYKTQVN